MAKSTTGILSICLYGSKTLFILSNIERRINIFDTRYLLVLLGISYKDQVRIEVIYEKSKQKSLIELVNERQLQWISHAVPRKIDEPFKTFV